MSSYVKNQSLSRAGLSLAGMVGIVAVIALAVLGLQNLLQRSECQLAFKAIAYLEHIKELQQQHFVEHGYYAPDPMKLDVALVVPSWFSVEPTATGTDVPARDSWSMTLTRQGDPYVCRKYRVTYNQQGLVPDRSLVEANIIPYLSSLVASQVAH
jgi:hypothetical protein